jgi:hypothetical protein
VAAPTFPKRKRRRTILTKKKRKGKGEDPSVSAAVHSGADLLSPFLDDSPHSSFGGGGGGGGKDVEGVEEIGGVVIEGEGGEKME